MKELMFFVILFAADVLAQVDDRRIRIERYPCPKVCYTQWFDRDNPSGYGDYETLLNLRVEYPGQICDHPYSIEVQTVSGQIVNCPDPAFDYCDTVNGFACVNLWKPKRRCCLDYKVRFVCPCRDSVIALEFIKASNNTSSP